MAVRVTNFTLRRQSLKITPQQSPKNDANSFLTDLLSKRQNALNVKLGRIFRTLAPKMSKWNAPETGILRKKAAATENHDTLLVFGYACKLFRDDEKARFIDQGKHLIPWMGDDGLRIDRYDGRGALSDLKPYEASTEGYDATRWLGLSESERKIEQLCDDERYYSLLTNEEEEEMYKEEEQKRQKTNEFSFNYDVPQNPQEVSQNLNVPTVEEEDRDYVPRPELDVPADIAIPKKEKENARIEKTALFVSKQGLQMEILIKTKQAGNPQFSFLNQNDALYQYYKHVLNALKAGRYTVESSNEEAPKKEDADREQNDEHYLHPSLLQTSVQTSTTAIPTVTYKPTADCAYSQLVNRIQGSQGCAGDASSVQPKAEAGGAAQLTYEQQQQYYQYYYSVQYYEYYKQLVQQYHSMGGTDGQTIPPPVQDQINNQAAAFAQIAISQYVQQQPSNPYAQIVSNLSHVKEISVAPDPQPPSSEPQNTETVPKKTPETELKKKALVYYSSETDSDEAEAADEEEEEVKVPPDETRLVIEKMASYVAKNGTDFESIVKSKGDARFDFLLDDHVYHKFYKKKIGEFSSGKKVETKEEAKGGVNGIPVSKPKDKKVIAPVCFSIKKPKEEMPKDIKSALPLEESDDELEPDAATAAVTPSSSVAQQVVQAKLSDPLVPVNQSPPSFFQSAKDPVVKESGPKQAKGDEPAQKNGAAAAADDPILEMIDLTEDPEERKDARRAEDKIKDKLAAAAREKMALVAKDRALQLERRKKAAAFLKLKAAAQPEGEKKKGTTEEDKVLVISDTDNKSEKVKGQQKEKGTKKEESESEEGEIKKRKSKKKKTYHHKRKRSRSRKRSSSRHKKTKRKRKRLESSSSTSSKE